MKTHRLTHTIALATVALALVALLIPAPATAKNKKKPAPVDITKLVWPLPPEIARIRFLGVYTGEDVAGRRKQGLLERLAGVQDMTSRAALLKPYGVAVDSKGRAFVSDTALDTVFVFDLEQKTLEYRGDKPPATFRKPMGLACDEQDRLFVADAEAHNVTVFSPAGDVLNIFGQEQLGRPVGVAVDSALGRLYVSDMKRREVAVFDLKTLKFENWVGKSYLGDKVEDGDRDKILYSPTNLAVDGDGLLYVVDTFINHVTVFDPDGEFVRHIGDIGQGPGLFMRPRGIALDPDGHVYITDAMANLFQILTPEGQALMSVGGLGETPGRFQVPGDIAVDQHNRVFVVDQANRRLQVFRYVTDEEATELAAKQGKTLPALSGKKAPVAGGGTPAAQDHNRD